MQKKLVIFLLIIIIAAGAWIFFKDDVLKLYHRIDQGVQRLQETDLGTILTEVTNQIVAPGPLAIGGKANAVVLTKENVIIQTNLQRQSNGSLPPVIENTKLDAAALAKVNDIFKNQYFEHVSPSGIDPGTLIKNFGYQYIVSGENLILGNFGSEQEVVRAWMNSPGHRANILNNRFVEIGVAMVKGTYKGQTVWVGVQEFGTPLSSCASVDASLKTHIDTNKAKLEQLSMEIDARKNVIDNTDPHAPGYNDLVKEHNQLVAEYNQLAQTTKAIVAEYNAQINKFNQCVVGK